MFDYAPSMGNIYCLLFIIKVKYLIAFFNQGEFYPDNGISVFFTSHAYLALHIVNDPETYPNFTTWRLKKINIDVIMKSGFQKHLFLTRSQVPLCIYTFDYDVIFAKWPM